MRRRIVITSSLGNLSNMESLKLGLLDHFSLQSCDVCDFGLVKQPTHSPPHGHEKKKRGMVSSSWTMPIEPGHQDSHHGTSNGTATERCKKFPGQTWKAILGRILVQNHLSHRTQIPYLCHTWFIVVWIFLYNFQTSTFSCPSPNQKPAPYLHQAKAQGAIESQGGQASCRA